MYIYTFCYHFYTLDCGLCILNLERCVCLSFRSVYYVQDLYTNPHNFR